MHGVGKENQRNLEIKKGRHPYRLCGYVTVEPRLPSVWVLRGRRRQATVSWPRLSKICYVKTQCTSDGRAVLTRPPGKWWELLSFMSTSPCSTFKVGNQIYLCSLDMSGSKICEKTVPNQSKNQWSDATCSLVLLKTAYWEARITYLAKWDPFGWALGV